MFRNHLEEEEVDSQHEDAQKPDYKVALLSFKVKKIGALFSSSKQSYHWGFHFKQTGENDTDNEQDW